MSKMNARSTEVLHMRIIQADIGREFKFPTIPCAHLQYEKEYITPDKP